MKDTIVHKTNIYTLVWLGYNDKPNYNRIWGWIKMNNNQNYAFWGVCGQKLDFKFHHYDFSLSSTKDKMIKKGFKSITLEEYQELYPSFIDDLEIWYTAAVLSDTMR